MPPRNENSVPESGGLRPNSGRKHFKGYARGAVLKGGIPALLCVTSFAAAETSNGTNIFAPASTPAKMVANLSGFVLAITGIIFVVVFTLLVYSIIKFRERAVDAGREPAQVYGSTQIELAWTIIPVLIVVVLFLATARVIHAIQDAPQPPAAIEVTVIGHQFWWEFRYPKLGVVTANELHIPVSDPANPTPTFLTLLSADTDHSFWIPELAGKTDLIPNRPNRDVDGPAAHRNLSRPVRAVLRNSTRQDAVARLGGQPRRFCRLGARPATARRSGRKRRDGQASFRKQRLHELSCREQGRMPTDVSVPTSHT